LISGAALREGWVDVELKETREGDEQAVKKIIQVLGVYSKLHEQSMILPKLSL
jgi:hypothetical protein